MTFNFSKNTLLIIVSIGIILRLIYTFVPKVDYYSKTSPIVFDAGIQENDSKTYVNLGKGILEKGYPNFLNTEGFENKIIMFAGCLYPYFVALFLFFSNNLISLILLQILLDGATIYFIYGIAKGLSCDRKTGIIASISYALFYPNMQYTSRVLTEPLFIFLLVAGIYLIVINKEKKLIYIDIFTGVVLSLAALTRPIVIYVFIVLSIVILIRKIYLKNYNFKPLILTFLFFIIIQIPWSLLGYYHTGKIVVGSTAGGLSLLIGSYIPARGDNIPAEIPDHPMNKLKEDIKKYNLNQAQGDSAASGMAKEQILANIKNEPLNYVKVMFLQFSRLWYNYPYFTPPSIGTFIYAFVIFVLQILGLTGLISFYRKGNRELTIFLFACFCVFVCLQILGFSIVRYSAPLIPFLLIYSAGGINMLLKNLQNYISKENI